MTEPEITTVAVTLNLVVNGCKDASAPQILLAAWTLIKKMGELNVSVGNGQVYVDPDSITTDPPVPPYPPIDEGPPA